MQQPFSEYADSEAFVIERTVLESTNPDVLTDIYDPAHNMVIWKREVSQKVLSSIDQLFREAPSVKVSVDVTPETAREDFLDAFKGSDSAKALCDDIANLVDMFCCLFDLKRVGLRLTKLEHAMCPRFHVDNVPCRLVTTFCGEATEWLTHDDVDRTKLGRGNKGLPDAESGLFQNPSDIQKLAPGDVALLKGELWEGNENAGLVHRSPELKPGQKRLLMTLDFIG